MNILFVILVSYGCMYGFQNTFTRITCIIHGEDLKQSKAGEIMDGLFYVGVVLLCLKHEEVTLWGLL